MRKTKKKKKNIGKIITLAAKKKKFGKKLTETFASCIREADNEEEG